MARSTDGTRAVGIEDVARAASVSITTVSHALSGRGQVAEATRARVRQVAHDLGYAPNRLASALRSRRSNILGFVSDDIATTPFATRVVLGAQEAATERDQLLVVVNAHRDEGVEARQLAGLSAAQVDAMVYARMFHQDSAALPAQLHDLPTVLIDTTDVSGRIPSVVPDEEQIGELATQTLIDAGHKHIAHLTVSGIGRGSVGRAAGYERAMRRAGLEPRTFLGSDPGDTRAGRAAFAAMIAAEATDITGVVCFNDPMAMGVYQAAVRIGVSIPGDLSVVGVDDFEPVAAGLLPGLTTVALPHYEMGRWAVESVLELLDGPRGATASITRLPGRLVVRDSVRVVRSRARRGA